MFRPALLAIAQEIVYIQAFNNANQFMDQNQFKVIYTGQLQDGFESDAVAEAFAQRFKLLPAKAKKIIEAGREVVVKSSAEHVKAYKMKSLLESIGMVVRLERAALVKPPTVTEPSPPLSDDQPPSAEASVPSDQAHNTAEPKTTATPSQSSPTTPTAGAWELEPMAEESAPADEAAADSAADLAAPTPATPPAYNDMRRPDKVLEPVIQKSVEDEPSSINEDAAEEPPRSTHRSRQAARKKGQSTDQAAMWKLVQTIGGWVLGIVGVLFILIKKFGLFKFLKIGGLVTASAFAGYQPDEICMGNARCEAAVEDQVDHCWEQAGMDDIDVEVMSDEAYDAIKPKIEDEFVGCFRYEDTLDRVFVSPLDLRLDLIDNCYLSDNPDCMSLAESQFKSCYDRHQIAYLVSANTTDFYQEVSDHANNFKGYYACFLDNQGGRLFSDIIDQWDEVYY
ncbi:hypothetical protein [Marinicella meishanensis]|uniref:hypothetical protein n=1 Tax=Marinicella meishanensis TaxID=2873263 RepID=UPI001CBEF137|nr:hypothetical protein [Marinicella sp. NBU2979]